MMKMTMTVVVITNNDLNFMVILVIKSCHLKNIALQRRSKKLDITLQLFLNNELTQTHTDAKVSIIFFLVLHLPVSSCMSFGFQHIFRPSKVH